MNYKVKIYQINAETAQHKLFEGFSGEPINMNDYKFIYETVHKSNVKDPIRVLNEVYQSFNISKPKDFKGHSLSVSDIVLLNGIPYYVDRFGFKLIDDIC